MQKKIIHIISVLFAASILLTRVSAQEGMVRYKYILNVDSTQYPKNTEGVPAFLYFNRGKSLFAFNRFSDTAFINKKTQETSLSDGAVVSYEERDEYGNMFYKDFVAGKLSMRRLIFKGAFIAEEPLPMMRWSILTNTRKIGGFNCKKATTHFRGRDYEAWFAPDLPVSDGPWKLRGLPGLILEAYDKDREIQYLFESIKFPYPVTNDITAPKKGIPISFEAFKHIEQTQADRMVKMFKASMNRKDEVDIKIKVFPIEKDYL